MEATSPVLHMDEEYFWRWYIPNAKGVPVAISAKRYFHLADAQSDLQKLRIRCEAANDN